MAGINALVFAGKKAVIGMMAMKRMAGSPGKAKSDLPFDLDECKNDAEQVHISPIED